MAREGRRHCCSKIKMDAVKMPALCIDCGLLLGLMYLTNKSARIVVPWLVEEVDVWFQIGFTGYCKIRYGFFLDGGSVNIRKCNNNIDPSKLKL